MRVIRVSHQGYCSGVKRALDIVNKAYENNPNKQIYILGNIINNRYVSNQFLNKGIITIDTANATRLEMLESINKDGLVILTAHGVSPRVYEYLKKEKIEYIDATCPFVSLVSKRINKHLADDYEIIYIGKHNHPESEGIIDINVNKVHLVTNTSEVDNLSINNKNILVDTQTTLSKFVTDPIFHKIKEKYPHAKLASGVCDATTIRQQALMNELEGELCLVVGDKISSNANELLKIASKKMPAYLINHVSEIKKEWLEGVTTITLTSAASTPKELTDEIEYYLTKNIND